MKLTNCLSLALLLCHLSACWDTLTTPNEDAEVDAGMDDVEGLVNICPESVGPCAEVPRSTEGNCMVFAYYGKRHEFCFDGPHEGVITIAEDCECNPCLQITYSLLGGGEESCGACDEPERTREEETLCPPTWEGE